MSPSRRRAIARGGSPPRCAAWHPAFFARKIRAAITHAHYPGGAIGTSRPTAITPANFACVLSARCGAPPRRAPPPCLTLVSTRPRPLAAPYRPHPVAARHSPVAARHCRHPVRQDSLSFNVSATAERTLSGEMECRQIPDFKPHERLWHGQHDGSPVACKTVCELP